MPHAALLGGILPRVKSRSVLGGLQERGTLREGAEAASLARWIGHLRGAKPSLEDSWSMLPWKQDKARSRRGGGWSQLLITANGPERAGKVHESSKAALSSCTTLAGPCTDHPSMGPS